MRQFIASLSAGGGAIVPPITNTPVKIGFITDIHWALYNGGGAFYYTNGLTKWQNAITAFNSAGVDFVVNNGDVTDGDVTGGGISKTNQEIYMAQMESAAGSLTMPYYYLLGNHDMDTGTKADVANNLSIDAPYYYYFDFNNVRFICLDSNYNLDDDGSSYEFGDYYVTPISNVKKYIPPTQKAWLAATLASAPHKAVVFCHHPMTATQVLASQELNNATDIRAILEASGKVLAVFTGHEHANDYDLVNGIPYFGMDDAATQTVGNLTYAVIDIDNTSVTVTGYGTQTSYIFP